MGVGKVVGGARDFWRDDVRSGSSEGQRPSLVAHFLCPRVYRLTQLRKNASKMDQILTLLENFDQILTILGDFAKNLEK